MSLPVVWRRTARAEFDEAYDWYEQRQPGLGDAFADHVQKVITQIAATPLIHAAVLRDIRKAVVVRFPYAVYYRVKKTHLVILSVFHGRRDPAIWQSRS